jgi:murein L,D-transpeptidase YafK
MYEYRILFPRLGNQQIRRELRGDPRTEGDRRRPEGAYRPERQIRQERA